MYCRSNEQFKVEPIKVVIFYFSGTGNTWWAAQTLAVKLRENNASVKVLSLESEKVQMQRKLEQILVEADVLGIGYPIYGSDCPGLVKEFLKQRLPKGNRKAAFVFTTMMLFSGDGAMVAARMLRKKGYKVNQAINIKMMNNIRLPYLVLRSLPIINEKENTKLKQKAEEKIVRLAANILAGKKWLQGRDPFNIAGGLMQRVPMKILKPAVFAKYFFVDKESCTQCMQCVDYCPTNNILFAEGEFHFGGNCIACFRCYNLCPENAIQHKKGTLNRERFPRYKGPGNGFTIAKLKE